MATKRAPAPGEADKLIAPSSPAAQSTAHRRPLQPPG